MPVGSPVRGDGLCAQGFLARTIAVVSGNRAAIRADKPLSARKIEVDILPKYFLGCKSEGFTGQVNTDILFLQLNRLHGSLLVYWSYNKHTRDCLSYSMHFEKYINYLLDHQECGRTPFSIDFSA
jgi:hypothetical protein